MKSSQLSLSICVPLFNEKETVYLFAERLFQVLDSIDGSHEVIFVNDGSEDGTADSLSNLLKQKTRHKIICIYFSRNFGHQLAVSAALDVAEGDACVIMDGDLQDSPESIPVLLDKFKEGFDVVYARRMNRKEHFLLRISYSLFYRIISYISELSLPLDAGDFSIISNRVVEVIKSCKERNRYVRGLRAWSGFRQVGIEIQRDSRVCGKSKYTLVKLLGLAFDGICSFSIIPLRLAVFCGAVGVFFTFLYLFYTITALLFFDKSPPGFAAIILLLSFLSSLQLLSMGVLGEYIGKIYTEVKMRPLYIVDKIETNRLAPDE
jgi:glycosyltransferase involved in cell wall biosynthesis